MTLEEYNTIDEAFKEAEKDDTPFVVVAEDEIVVAGDANKTQISKYDFEIMFRIPQEKEDGGYKYVTTSKEFKNVFITPRQDTKVVKALSVLLAYFRRVEEKNGDLNIMDLSTDEKLDVINAVDDEMLDAMYDVVSSVLGIDKELADYMMPASVIQATAQILENFKGAVNEADTFFGSSSAKRQKPVGRFVR